MKLLHLIALVLCVNTPLAYTANNEIITGVSINNEALYKLAHGMISSGVYATIGTAAALCGCYLTTLGIKRACCEENKIKNGLVLSGSGIACILIGLKLALPK